MLTPKSKEYYYLIEQYKIIHEREYYGAAGSNKAQYILPYINFRVNSILDYGCGRSILADTMSEELKCAVYRFDPAVEEFNCLPEKVNLVLCTDTLEHIPETDLVNVLKDIRSISDKCFFIVCTRPAAKVLPDGRNAHAVVAPTRWWVDLIRTVFDKVVVVLDNVNEGFHAKTW